MDYSAAAAAAASKTADRSAKKIGERGGAQAPDALAPVGLVVTRDSAFASYRGCSGPQGQDWLVSTEQSV
jgi:hypothetical protein